MTVQIYLKMVHIGHLEQKTIETIEKMRKSNKTLCTWNKIVDKIVICDNVTTLNDMAVNKSYIRYIFILNFVNIWDIIKEK